MIDPRSSASPLAGNHPFAVGNTRIPCAAADAFLGINGWRLRLASIQIGEEMPEMFESGTFRVDPRLTTALQLSS